MTTEQWADFLAKHFDDTDYAAPHSAYWGWCAAGVESDDDPESVAEAWIEQCRELGRPDAQAELARFGGDVCVQAGDDPATRQLTESLLVIDPDGSESDLWHGTVAEYRRLTPECTGEFENANGDIVDEDTEITVSGDGEQYCIGRYDGNQTWLDL